MLYWAVVSAQSEQAIKLFPTRDEAEEMLALVLEDEPGWQDVLRIEPLKVSHRLVELAPGRTATSWGLGAAEAGLAPEGHE
jgi:hypothetical protein